MTKYLVRYNNKLHNVSLAGMTTKERSLFFAICYFLKEKGTNEITFSFEQLKALSKYSSSSVEQFKKTLSNTYRKLINLTFHDETEDKISEFVLFTKYEINKKEKVVTIKLNEDYEYILNHLDRNYTEHEMLEYSSLKSDYSQLTYALLKKWETTKKVEISLEKYRELLEIPVTYSTTNFNKRVLNQVMRELPQYFCGLELEKIKTGKKVTDLRFTWNYKKTVIKETDIINIKISAKLNKSIEKARKNRFIKNLLTDKNIEKLLSKFEEEELIKGLNACYKEVNKEIKSINYLIKTIETASNKKIKKIVLEDNSEIEEAEIVEKQEVNNIKEKIKVSQEEYEQLYEMYLLKNNITNNPFVKKGFSIPYEIVDKNELVLSEKYKNLIKEYQISENEILNAMSEYMTRETSIEKIVENRKYNQKIADKEYEEFLAWKKWKEKNMEKK